VGALCPRNTPSGFNDTPRFLFILICMPNFNFIDRLASELNREVPKFVVGALCPLTASTGHVVSCSCCSCPTCIQNRNFLVRLFSDIYICLTNLDWGNCDPYTPRGGAFLHGARVLVDTNPHANFPLPSSITFRETVSQFGGPELP